MTRKIMIEFMKENPYIKITHPLFSSNEYIYQKEDGKIYDENGNIFEDWKSDISNGLRLRYDGEWENDWCVKRDKGMCKILSKTISGKEYLYNNLCKTCQYFRSCSYI